MVHHIVDVPAWVDSLIREAIGGFLTKEPDQWETHLRYHDEPIWILRREKSAEVQRIQLACFDQAEGRYLYLTPDSSRSSGEKLSALRREGQGFRIPFQVLKKEGKVAIIAELQKVAKLLDEY